MIEFCKWLLVGLNLSLNKMLNSKFIPTVLDRSKSLVMSNNFYQYFIIRSLVNYLSVLWIL